MTEKIPQIPPKKSGKIRVLAFGAFDIIHPGHIDFLKNAKKLGDELFIIVGKDVTIEKHKGKKPSFSEEERRAQVQSLHIADGVFVGFEDDYLKLPLMISPDIIALGYDQNAPMKLLAEYFPTAKITRLSPHFPEQFKSSKFRSIFPSS
ncbi:adenylyltransferase/cytidyltransferase family protein [Candidatus Peregrinibacteria bacterium]|nr:adenylyltransferase/cytidyltransferase family protein [Candidatus Peregrinibacteria bacterium]